MPNGSLGTDMLGNDSQSKLGTSTREMTCKNELALISGLAPDKTRKRVIANSCPLSSKRGTNFKTVIKLKTQEKTFCYYTLKNKSKKQNICFAF